MGTMLCCNKVLDKDQEVECECPSPDREESIDSQKTIIVPRLRLSPLGK